MTTCLGMNCIFGLLCESLVHVFQMYVFVFFVFFFHFGFEVGMWDFIVFIFDCCLSIYFVKITTLRTNELRLI